ncbi:hypothetical protein Q8W71_10010 [Methylobacterium sp. NEAU 140]|uniref:hypothetical protein n=1 Tax=Methylobacterium sp. NEAU 140 TaxID=3064945 RepID=UPI002733126B|nr:hypothetical protein [Methylobacterium sp. NEAU 140]MDP4022957.1 hypothetical protein [Methylobacterium sp. NEAU 140]
MRIRASESEQARIRAQAAEMAYVPAVKHLRMHIGTPLTESMQIARQIADEMPDSPLARSMPPRPERVLLRERGQITAEIEKAVAGCCFPSNPDMSGDPRRKLSPSQMRRVEVCAEAIMEIFREAGFQPPAEA